MALEAGLYVAALFGGRRGLKHGATDASGAPRSRRSLRRAAWIETTSGARAATRKGRRRSLRRAAWIETTERRQATQATDVAALRRRRGLKRVWMVVAGPFRGRCGYRAHRAGRKRVRAGTRL